MTPLRTIIQGLNSATGLASKQVTVLTANLVGVHAMVQHLGVGVEVRLSQAVDVMIAAVKKCRGTVVSFAGGTVFAAFNAVINSHSHARFASQCALAMRDALEDMSPPVSVLIGIHTCNVLAGNIGYASCPQGAREH